MGAIAMVEAAEADLEAVAERTLPGSRAERTVLQLAREGMTNGGLVVLHVTGQGESSKVLASETW